MGGDGWGWANGWVVMSGVDAGIGMGWWRVGVGSVYMIDYSFKVFHTCMCVYILCFIYMYIFLLPNRGSASIRFSWNSKE